MTTDYPGLDLPTVLSWLASTGVELTEPVTATLFPGGRSNVTYRLTGADGRSVVVRRPPLGHVLPSAHDMSREHRVLSGLHRVGYPVPAPLALCEDLRVNGSPFLVMEYVDGRIVATARQAGTLTAEQSDSLCDALIGTLVLLHATDVHAAGLGDLGRPQGYLPRQLHRWTTQWELTKTRDLVDMDDLRDRIGERIGRLPEPPWSLVHGDYRLDNVIFTPDADRVRAVLDWEMSTLGDPLSDLALTLVYWTQSDDRRRHLIPVAQHLTDGPGFWDRERLVAEYVSRSGADVEHLDLRTALACFKLAVITEQIHARTLSGKQLGTAAGDTHAMGVATEALAAMGLAVLADGTVAGLAS